MTHRHPHPPVPSSRRPPPAPGGGGPAIDPVCGMEVDPRAPRGGSWEHEGHTWFFCGPKCRQRFQADPARFLQPPTSPPPAAPGAVYVCPMDPEESAGVRAAFDKEGVDLVPLCAPTTPPARAEAIARDARGFVYCVSVAGVTGMRAALPPDLSRRLDLVKRAASVPVVAGFGISNADTARPLVAHADGVVVGSALVKAAHADGPAAARQLCADIKRGLKR